MRRGKYSISIIVDPHGSSGCVGVKEARITINRPNLCLNRFPDERRHMILREAERRSLRPEVGSGGVLGVSSRRRNKPGAHSSDLSPLSAASSCSLNDTVCVYTSRFAKFRGCS